MAMIDDVKARLESMGYEVDEETGSTDLFLINFMIQKTEAHIKNSCNISSIPDGLYQIAVDMACGNFLYEKKAVDADSLTGFDLDAAVKQISEGDTSITYALGEGSTTPEARLDAFIAYLIGYGEKDFVTYRCMTW